MKQLVLVGILTCVLAGVGFAQGTEPRSAPTTGQKATATMGRTSSRVQAGSSNVLGSITLPANVTADGQPLPKGTYQVRLSNDEVKPAAGASPNSERWVEFVQRGQVKGREVASVFANNDAPTITEDKQAPPPAGRARVQLLKEKQYYRVWISKGGNSYLIHLPPA